MCQGLGRLLGMVGNGLAVLRRGRGILVVIFFLLLLTPTGLTRATGDSSAAGDDLDQCAYSEQILQHDVLFNRYNGSKLRSGPASTYIPLMAGRFVLLREALRGLNCSGVPLVAFDGRRFRPAGTNDDIGLYWLVPAIAARTGLVLATAFDLTFGLVIFLGTGIGYAGYWRVFTSRRFRLGGAAVFLALAALQVVEGDVYVFQSAPIIAATPWLVGYAIHQDRRSLAFTCVLFALAAGCCAVVRSTAGLPCAAFLALLVLGSYRAPRAVLLLLLLGAASLLPTLLMHHEIKRRDAFLAASPGAFQEQINRHLFWHAAYVGLGYWSNSEVPAFDDKFAGQKAESLRPNVIYGSPEYEATLRHEVWRIFTHEPQIVFINVAVKLAVISAMILALAIPAISSILKREKRLGFDGAFAAGTLTSSLVGLIVAPRPRYLLGMICFVAMYALLSWSLDQRRRATAQF